MQRRNNFCIYHKLKSLQEDKKSRISLLVSKFCKNIKDLDFLCFLFKVLINSLVIGLLIGKIESIENNVAIDFSQSS